MKTVKRSWRENVQDAIAELDAKEEEIRRDKEAFHKVLSEGPREKIISIICPLCKKREDVFFEKEWMEDPAFIEAIDQEQPWVVLCVNCDEKVIDGAKTSKKQWQRREDYFWGIGLYDNPNLGAQLMAGQ